MGNSRVKHQEATTGGGSRDNHVLEDAIARAESAGDGRATVSGQELIEQLGERSFGPLLLVPSLILVSPASGIVGLPTLGAIVIALISVQMLFGRERVWLPAWLKRRKIKRSVLNKMRTYLLPAARVIDRLVYPRLGLFVRGLARRVIAGLCLAISAIMPLLEIVPLGNTITAAAVAIYALAITARDGLLALLALCVTAGAGWLIVTHLI